MAWVSNRQRGLVDRRCGSVAWPGFLIDGSVFEWVCVCVCGLALLLGCVCVWLCCWVVFACGFVAGLMFVFLCVGVVMGLDRLIGV